MEIMTEEQKIKTRNLRAAGYGYTKVAQMLGLSENTIKSFCRRNGLNGVASQKVVIPINKEEHFCLCCGVDVKQNPGRKLKKFCSDRCRNKWWNSHLDQVNRKAHYEYICANCGKSFSAYGNPNRKYCCHECYIEDRFGGGNHE